MSLSKRPQNIVAARAVDRESKYEFSLELGWGEAVGLRPPTPSASWEARLFAAADVCVCVFVF